MRGLIILEVVTAMSEDSTAARRYRNSIKLTRDVPPTLRVDRYFLKTAHSETEFEIQRRTLIVRETPNGLSRFQKRGDIVLLGTVSDSAQIASSYHWLQTFSDTGVRGVKIHIN